VVPGRLVGARAFFPRRPGDRRERQGGVTMHATTQASPWAGDPSELFTIAEAAAHLHCGPRTVSRLIASGRLRHVKLSRRFSRVPLAELRRLAGIEVPEPEPAREVFLPDPPPARPKPPPRPQERHDCAGCGIPVARARGLCDDCRRCPGHRERGRLFLQLLAAVTDPGRPTDALPGTPAKVATLAARRRAGLPLWLPGDPTAFAWDGRGIF